MSKFSKYRFNLDLQQFNDGESSEVPEVAESPSVEADVNPSDEGNAPSLDSNVTNQKSFANRLKESTDKALAEARKQWEEEVESRYKDHDVYKQAAEYLQKRSGINDIMTLKEEIEMQKLQERAEERNMDPEELKRLDELEAKAKRGEEAEKKLEEIRNQQEQAKEVEEFEKSLKTFSDGKEIDGKALDYKELWTYMADNEIGNPEIAYKAMMADVLVTKLPELKKDAVKEYLSSKQGVKVDGGSGAAVMDKGNASPRAKLEAALRAKTII